MAKRPKKRKKTLYKRKVKVRRKKIKLKYKKIKTNTKKNNQTNDLIYKIKSEWIKKSLINKTSYEKKYSQSLKDNDGFWKKEGKRITWIKPYTKIKDVKYSKSDVHIKWYYDGTLNASANCIDRHLKKNKDKTAIIWVGNDPKVQKKFHIKIYIKKFRKLQTV